MADGVVGSQPLNVSRWIQDFAPFVLLSPHHCSWHSLSQDSASAKGEQAKVSPDALKALGRARSGAMIVASSRAIKDDDRDPPCVRAKREYVDIVDWVSGLFKCRGDNGTASGRGSLWQVVLDCIAIAA